MYLIMELCEGGELADVLSQKKYFTEKDTKTIMSRVASAISYLHKNGKISQFENTECDNEINKLLTYLSIY